MKEVILSLQVIPYYLSAHWLYDHMLLSNITFLILAVLVL